MDIQLVAGAALMVLGVAVFIIAVFRALNHRWTFGVHELWLLPLTGIGLMLGGRWLVL
jgi:hypothetical protein